MSFSDRVTAMHKAPSSTSNIVQQQQNHFSLSELYNLNQKVLYINTYLCILKMRQAYRKAEEWIRLQLKNREERMTRQRRNEGEEEESFLCF